MPLRAKPATGVEDQGHAQTRERIAPRRGPAGAWRPCHWGHAVAGPAGAQGTSSDARPYDDKLMRLSEILGAVHYLRELCGGNDGQKWRDSMKEMMDSEGSSALRRARLTRSFNNGYRAYSRTYNVCSSVGPDRHHAAS